MSRKNSELLLKALQNPTKFKVIVLLSENDAMTVTHMARIVKVSRANLYHFVSEMVNEGLLLGPENKVKRNFVEKYYRLNKKVLGEGNEEEWQKTVAATGPEGLRDLLYSYLVSLSMQFRIIAEQVAGADDEALTKLNEMRRRHMILATYGLMPDDEYQKAVGELRKTMLEHEQNTRRRSKEPARNKLVVFCFPGSWT